MVVEPDRVDPVAMLLAESAGLRPRAARAGLALLVAIPLAAVGVLGAQRSAADAGGWIAVAGGLAVLARGVLVSRERSTWLLLGAAVLSRAAGDAFGVPKDAALVVYYVAVLSGTSLFIRRRRQRWDSVLDLLAVAFAVAAVTSTRLDATGGALFGLPTLYVAGDLVLAGLVAGLLVASGPRVGRDGLLLAAGLLGLIAVDAALVSLNHPFAAFEGTGAVYARPAAALLVAAAAWRREREPRSWDSRPLATLAAPFAALLALGVLLGDTIVEVGRVPHALAALAILSVTARTVLTLRRQRLDAERLRRAEERYRTLVEEMPAVTYVADVGEHGRWHYVSPQVEELLGYAPAAFESRASLWLELVHPDDRAGMIESEEALLRGQRTLESEYRMIARDGRTLHVRDVAVKVGPERMLGFLVDVTDRRHAELDAGRRAAQQSLVAKLGQRALAGASLQELFDEAVAGTAAVLDVELVEVLELRPADGGLLLRAGVGWQHGLVGHASIDQGRETLGGATLHAGGPVVVHDLRTETRFSGPPLLHRHGVVSALTTVIADGSETFGVLGALSTRQRTFASADVAFLEGVAHALAAAVQKTRADAALRQAERRFRRVLEGAPDGIVGVGPDGRIVLANDRAGELFGGELVGRPWRELGAGLAERPEDLLQLRARRADGSEFPAEVGVSSLEHGELLLASVRDVTERLREQDEHERLRTQVEQSQRLETIGQLAGGIAHDFNNVLLVIQSRAAFLAGKLGEGPGHDDVAKILDATDSAAALTRQLLQFSSRRHVQPVLVDVNEVAQRVHRLLDRSLGSNVRLELELGGALPPVEADPSRLEQVLLNLAVNARDAMPDGGEVRIETGLVQVASGTAQEHVRIRVSDTGTGMTADVREHIFDPFFTTKPADRGTGLGLATVHGIVTGAGGHLVVRSEPGAGTEIDVCLPAAAAPGLTR